MSRRIWAAVLICAALAGAAALFRQDAKETMAAEQLRGILCPVRLVLDAGHGGEDGGAVSLTGVPESRMNLAIALRLEDILAFCGLPSAALRREDISLYSDGAATLREKKVSDLHKNK